MKTCFCNITAYFKTAFLALGVAVAAVPALAQNPFSAAVRINDDIVTHYEIAQRAQFLELLRAPGDHREVALEALVNERLQTQAAERLGLVATPEQIEAGVAEFAARADLGPEQFLRQVAEEGVAPETVRDFVANGISWRNVVQRLFGSRSEITDEDVEEAQMFRPRLDQVQIQVAEIVVPLTPENQAVLRDELARLGADLNFDIAQFSEAARRFSVSSTRDNGGVTDWRPLTAVPGPLREVLLDLRVGEVTDPVALGPAFALLQLRGLRESAFSYPPVETIDYATIPLAGGRSPEGLEAAAALRAEVDVCDDLYGTRPGGFERVSQAPGSIPTDIAMALSTLDDGEISFDVTRQNGSVLLAVMLCDRVQGLPEGGLDALRGPLFSQRLESYAAGFLEELRADAIIDYTP